MSVGATGTHVQLNSQRLDVWKVVESDYDRLRAHEPHGHMRYIYPPPG